MYNLSKPYPQFVCYHLSHFNSGRCLLHLTRTSVNSNYFADPLEFDLSRVYCILEEWFRTWHSYRTFDIHVCTRSDSIVSLTFLILKLIYNASLENQNVLSAIVCILRKRALKFEGLWNRMGCVLSMLNGSYCICYMVKCSNSDRNSVNSPLLYCSMSFK